MNTKLLALAAAAAVGLAAYALVVMSGAEAEAEAVAELADANEVDPGPEATRPGQRGPRRPRLFEGRARAPGPDQAGEPDVLETDREASPSVPGSRHITLEDARTGFSGIMAKLDKLGRKRRVRKKTYDRYYRRANDAFAALSGELDARIPEQRHELDEAHRLLKERLGAIKVRRGKRRTTRTVP